MGSIHKVIEGACASSNSWTQLTTLGPQTLNYIVVPDGYTCVKKISVTLAMSTQTDAKGCLGALKLEGGAMVHMPYEFVVGGVTMGTKTTSGGQVRHMKPFIKHADLVVKPNQPLYVYGSQVTGADAGTLEFSVECEFTRGGGRKSYSMVRYGSVASLDTKTAMTTDPAGTSIADVQVPADCSRITTLTPALGAIGLGTATGGTALIRIEGAIPAGPQVFTGGGHGALITTDGIACGIFETQEIPADLGVTPNGRLLLYGEQCGVDWGTVYVGCALTFE